MIRLGRLAFLCLFYLPSAHPLFASSPLPTLWYASLSAFQATNDQDANLGAARNLPDSRERKRSQKAEKKAAKINAKAAKSAEKKNKERVPDRIHDAAHMP